jgi:hypothetical protein
MELWGRILSPNSLKLPIENGLKILAFEFFVVIYITDGFA